MCKKSFQTVWKKPRRFFLLLKLGDNFCLTQTQLAHSSICHKNGALKGCETLLKGVDPEHTISDCDDQEVYLASREFYFMYRTF